MKLSTRTIAVSAENIKGSKQRDSHLCMIADAIGKKVKWAKYIMVDLQSIRFSDVKSGYRFIYLTPPEAQKALLDFDQGRRVKPFQFTMSQGYARKMRVRAPNYVAIPSSNYDRNPHRLMPSRTREFGLRKLVKSAA